VAPDGLDMAQVRHAIRSGHKIALSYRDEQERVTERTVDVCELAHSLFAAGSDRA